MLYSQAGNPPTVEDERTFERYRSAKEQAFPRAIPYDVDELPALLDRSYDSFALGGDGAALLLVRELQSLLPDLLLFQHL